MLIALLALAALDIAWGPAASALESRVRSGSVVGVFNLVREARSDTLVVGSSRAYINFVPAEIGDAVMNAGVNGQGLATGRVMLSISPQSGGTVLIDPMFFEEELARLSAVHHLRGENPVVDDVIALAGWRESLKCRSNLYAHAHAVIPALVNFYSKQESWKSRSRELPVPQKLPTEPTGKPLYPEPFFWTQLDRLLDEVAARGARPVVVISPIANPRYDAFLDEVVRRCHGRCLVIDDRAHFPQTAEHFADRMHLNASGARIWSRRLRTLLDKPQNP